MKNCKYSIFTMLMAACVGFSGSAIAAGTMMQILSHRAVYDLSLDEATQRSGIATVAGRLVQEIEHVSCNGYTVNYQIVTRYGNTEGKHHLSDIRSTSWESEDGSSFRFSTRQYLNKALTDQTSGRATRGAEDKPGIGVLTKPSKETFKLDSSVVFPSEHMLRIMKVAAAGENFDRTKVYDGTSGKKVYSATSFVGKVRAPGETKIPEGVKQAGVLNSQRSWPVTVSFFDDSQPSGGEQTPSHEIQFVMFENGVSTDLVLDYGDFTVKGKLADLAVFDQEPCT